MIVLEIREQRGRFVLVHIDTTVVRIRDNRMASARYPISSIVGVYRTKAQAEDAAAKHSASKFRGRAQIKTIN